MYVNSEHHRVWRRVLTGTALAVMTLGCAPTEIHSQHYYSSPPRVVNPSSQVTIVHYRDGHRVTVRDGQNFDLTEQRGPRTLAPEHPLPSPAWSPRAPTPDRFAPPERLSLHGVSSAPTAAPSSLRDAAREQTLDRLR